MFYVVWAFIVSVLPKVLLIIFTALGVGVFTYQGLDFVIDSASSAIFTSYNNIATDALAILQIANVDTAINIILASFTAGIAIKTTMGGLKRINFL